MTLRDLYNINTAARGHWVICGTPTGIANTLEEWFVDGVVEGYNILLSTWSCRNSTNAALLRRAFEGQILCDHLGLPRAATTARLGQAARSNNDDRNLDANARKIIAIDKVKHRTVVPAIAATAIGGDIETGRATTYKAGPAVS